MTRKLSAILILSLLVVAFTAMTVIGRDAPDNENLQLVHKYVGSAPKAKLAGAEKPVYTGSSDVRQSLGFDGVNSESPGLTVGYTTYDYQHNGRMGRQVDWRSNKMVHFDWMKKWDSTLGEKRVTGYEAWDPSSASFVNALEHGGCNIHAAPDPPASNRSGYVTLDVTETGVQILGNHHDPTGGGYLATVWWGFAGGNCFFPVLQQLRIPDTVASSIPFENTEFEYIWPSVEYQVYNNDTVVHVFAQQSREGIQPQTIGYFRYVGGTNAGAWDYPAMTVDTVNDIGQTVTASRISGKVALAWMAVWPEVWGDNESNSLGRGNSQRTNDLFVKISNDMGASWGADINVTKFDSAAGGGWALHTDLSALIDTNDYLHVVWNARETPTNESGELVWPNFYGSRIFHWSDDPAQNDEVRVVKDANWDPWALLEDGISGDWCHGGAWNEMSLVKMQISECDGKFYCLFVQFNDIFNGIDDDCHANAYAAGEVSGTANGELHVSVSDNGGFNWDVSRNLTDSYTPSCEEGVLECDADQWPSMSRFGMQVAAGDDSFLDVPIVYPGGVTYAGDHYLDVFYVNDKYPGGAVQDAGVWTYNPMKWFRVACVDPIPNPVLAYSPTEIGDPTWTEPGVEISKTIKLENVGNAELSLSTPTIAYLGGTDNWIAWPSFPATISHLSPNFFDWEIQLNAGGIVQSSPKVLEAYLILETNALGGSTDSIYVKLVVAQDFQFPQLAEVNTDCTRLAFNNAGNMGDGADYGVGVYGDYNLNHFDDCDTIGNGAGSNNNANVFLYDGSPFILRTDGTEPTLNYYMFDSDWLTETGFRPQTDITVDSTLTDYHYGYTGKFTTVDSAFAVEQEFFAPNANDCFIVVKERFYNYTDATIPGVYVGDMIDWDIPSDSGSENGSGFTASTGETSLDLLYCFGAEYGDDTTTGYEANNCLDSDQRYGGLAFYNGYKTPKTGPLDSLENPAGPWWTEINADYVYPTGGFVAEEIHDKILAQGGGFETWVSTQPSMEDSAYQDLHMVAVYGQFDMAPGDVLTFVKIIASSNTGQAGLETAISDARTWIAAHPEIFTWFDAPTAPTGRCCYGDPAGPSCTMESEVACKGRTDFISWDEFLNCTDHPCLPAPTGRCCYCDVDDNEVCVMTTEEDCIAIAGEGFDSWNEFLNCTDHPCGLTCGGCCVNAGDANGNGAVNLLDITFLINFLYKSGAAPPCNDQADANGNNAVNLLDITFLINFLYKDGAAPVCGTTGT